MTGEKIREAVASLDPKNPKLWTKDGLPMVDAVSEAMGTEVTRDEIDSAASDMTRESVGQTGPGESQSGSGGGKSAADKLAEAEKAKAKADAEYSSAVQARTIEISNEARNKESLADSVRQHQESQAKLMSERKIREQKVKDALAAID